MRINSLVLLLSLFLGFTIASKVSKALEEFIASIPAAKLQGLPKKPGTIHKNEHFRLDMQGLTTVRKNSPPQSHNLQIQANRESKNKQVAKIAPATVAGAVKVPVAAPWPAEQVRKAFAKTIVV
ncbi:hypothetical protein HYFRA_00012809 [Hymenoscyphus fraxineus]|uniref:Uncharacterized protein n=1 Tax=Hymenoscyphus fraxineus TaxID=746836 RepID=A0A9N9PN19_9HELO|nr:hypothetical protein HYFRA_00012809 [Hymenoscyphus fraxineus]